MAMSSRRTPLANVPNGTNSPRHAPVVVGKRAYPSVLHAEAGYYQEPPLKKQLLDQDEAATRSPFRKTVYQAAESRPVLPRKRTPRKEKITRELAVAYDNHVYQKLDPEAASRMREERLKEAAEERQTAKQRQVAQSSFKSVKDVKAAEYQADIESIRLWQKYYRKVFPSFVFYFENIPDDTRYKFSRQIAALGAREEKFFSKDVTHVITTRPIPPPDIEPPQRTSTAQTSLPFRHQNVNGPVETVNPSLLDKTMPSRTRTRTLEDRQDLDILYRARKMGIKIWSLEKLHRVVSTINDTDFTSQHGHNSRNSVSTHMRGRAENDLSLALQNEKLHGYADRDTFRDIVPFKGPFIYVHDMDEKTRPVIVREYPKVAKRQDGIWPQFRSSRFGKCPFLIDEESKKEEREKKSAPQPKPPAHTVAVSKAPSPPQRKAKDVDYERMPREQPSAVPAYGNMVVLKDTRPQQLSTMNITQALKNNHWPKVPAASGIQPSNITSAIRSQMVSSTAAVPGAKASTSKEVHELKRKVLEKGNGIVPVTGTSSSFRPTDANMASRPTRTPVPRAAKTKAQGCLVPIREEIKEELTGSVTLAQGSRRMPENLKQTSEKKREPKPGYCENCREKYDDFDEHITTRKHRKFALNPANWVELDKLLALLARPLNPAYDGVPLDIEEGAL
ncbi:hypothetical protein VTO42DRAFT_1547 [Malbranchea cinnamomea]